MFVDPDGVQPSTRVEAAALVYVALPSVVFVAGWLAAPWSAVGALAIVTALAGLLLPQRGRWAPGPGPLLLPVAVIALLWVFTSGVGHFVYANEDWTVRDGVLRDLVMERWPVAYVIDGTATVLRAPIGYFLPVALIGKAWGLAAAENALFGWTALGVVLVFAMLVRDRPRPATALVRLFVFIAFSGMDIVGTIAHYNPHRLGDHLEWWAFLFQYSSQTTQLFWVPNHALPGWIGVAWLVTQDPRRLSIPMAVLFTLFAPLWSPLTAIGLAPMTGIAIVDRLAGDRRGALVRAATDWRVLTVLAVSLVLVFPYLVAGSDRVASGVNAQVRWVGEDIVPRYIEFVLFEFVGFAVLLLRRAPRDPLLWMAVALLFALPIYRFGPYNDLAMRASIPPLTYLAIRLGDWLSTPRAFARDRRSVIVACLLLAVGAVTPFMEVARVFLMPARSMNAAASLIDVTRGTHYLTPIDQPWMRRFLRQAP